MACQSRSSFSGQESRRWEPRPWAVSLPKRRLRISRTSGTPSGLVAAGESPPYHGAGRVGRYGRDSVVAPHAAHPAVGRKRPRPWGGLWPAPQSGADHVPEGPVGARSEHVGESPAGAWPVLTIAQTTDPLDDPCLPAPECTVVPRNEDHMILAFPTHVCQTLKVLHTLFLLPNRAFPGVKAYAISGHAGTA
jgi:hypothetical protein